MLINLLAFVFVLGVLIVLHESGHFLVARLLKAPVDVFSVGFGKRIWGFERGGTDYRLSMIPLGGYVHVIGLGPDESTVTGSEDGDAGEPELLPRWKRVLIFLGGPLTNIIAAVAFLAFAFVLGVQVPAYQSQPPVVGWVEPASPAAAAGIVAGDRIVAVDGTAMATWRDLESTLMTAGGRQVLLKIDRAGRTIEVPITPKKVTRYGIGYSGIMPPLDPIVVQLQPNSPAQQAGLKPGDRIVAVDGQPVHQFYDLIRLISPNPGKTLELTVERDGRTVPLEVTPKNVGGEGKIGIPVIYPTTMEKLGPVAAVGEAVRECKRMTAETFRIIGRLLTRKASMSQLSGPIDIARISGQAAREGIRTLIWLLGFISLQLGIFNLLPIPILDGGHLTILAVEIAMRRNLPMKLKERILEVGFVLLMLLMVVVIFNDIVKILPNSLYQKLFHGGGTP